MKKVHVIKEVHPFSADDLTETLCGLSLDKVPFENRCFNHKYSTCPACIEAATRRALRKAQGYILPCLIGFIALLFTACAGVRVYVPDRLGVFHRAADVTANGPYRLAYRSGGNSFILTGTADCATATAAQGTAALHVLQGAATLTTAAGAAVYSSGIVKVIK